MKIEFTESAQRKLKSYLDAQKNNDGQVLRIRVSGGGPMGFSYQFFLDDEKTVPAGDVKETFGSIRVVADAASAKQLEGSTVDWVESVSGSGFKVENPNQKGADLSSPTAKKIQELLDNEINPAVAAHGGVVQLVSVEGSRAYVRLGGGCHGCGMANVTLKQGVEVRIKEAVPEIEEVLDVTDHAHGSNPYYNSDH